MDRAVRRFLIVMLLWVSQAARSSADVATDQYAVAAGHYAAERWQLASEEFQAFLKDYASHAQAPQARFYLAESFVQLGQLDQARRLFEEVLSSDSKSPLARQAHFRKAEASFLAGDDTTATRDLNTFVKQYPNDELDAYVLPYLGELALRSGKPKEAIEYYDAATARFAKGPLAEECRFGAARAHEQLGERDRAKGEYELLAKDAYAPLADKAQFQLGVMHNGAGHYEDALAAFNLFNERFKDSALKPQVELARGWSLYKLEKYAEAENVLKPLVDNGETAVEASYWLGCVYAAQKRWPEANESLQAAARVSGEHWLQPAVTYQVGELLRQQGELGKAAEQFEKLLSTWPNDAHADDALFARLQIAIAQEDHAAALRIASEFLNRFAGSSLDVTAECRSTIAVCHARLGKISEATVALAELKTAAPTSDLIASTTYKVAEAAFQSGELATAKSLFAELTADGNTAEWKSRGLAGLAWSQLKSDDLAESSATFEKLLNEHPDDPLASSAALLRGQALEKLDKLEPALAMYRRVINDYPQSNERSRAILRAALLHDKLGQTEEARALYRQFSQLQPPPAEVATALFQWGCLEADGGDAEQARQLWQRVRDEHPGSSVCADATYRLAAAALEDQQPDVCDKLLDELAIKTLPDELRPHALYLSGRSAVAQEQWEKVATPLERLIADYPDHALTASAHYWIAEATYRQANYQQAEEQFARLETKPHRSDDNWAPMACLRRAQSLAQLGKWSEALELAREIERDHPQFQAQHEVDYLIGRSLANDADFAGAREAYTKVVQSQTGSKTETAAMAQWMIGESYLHQEDYAAALKAYLRVDILYAYPRWQAAALLQAGKCQEQLNQWRQAAETYSKLVETYPDSEVAAEATKRLVIAREKQSDRKITK